MKDIHSGIWALGKSISSTAKDHIELGGGDALPEPNGQHAPGTDSKEFKTRAVELWKGGKTQANAIKTTSEEMGITLKQSYIAYPGSHCDRWQSLRPLAQTRVLAKGDLRQILVPPQTLPLFFQGSHGCAARV